MGEASASDHNKFMKDRESVETRDKGTFTAEAYVQKMLGRKASSSALPPAKAEPTVVPPGEQE